MYNTPHNFSSATMIEANEMFRKENPEAIARAIEKAELEHPEYVAVARHLLSSCPPLQRKVDEELQEVLLKLAKKEGINNPESSIRGRIKAFICD